MALPSLPFILKERFPGQDFCLLLSLVFLAIGSPGCSESGDQATPDRQESQSPTVQDTSKDQQTASIPSGQEQEEPMIDTKTQIIRQEVRDQLADANKAVEKADNLLRRAPTGKGSDLALAALQQELESARSLLQNGQAQFDDQKFEMAKADAGQAKGKADKVIQQVEQAMDAVTRHSP